MIAAQRVPPSACSTSQSTVICRSPSATRSTPARRRAPDQPLDLLGAARTACRRPPRAGCGSWSRAAACRIPPSPSRARSCAGRAAPSPRGSRCRARACRPCGSGTSPRRGGSRPVSMRDGAQRVGGAAGGAHGCLLGRLLKAPPLSPRPPAASSRAEPRGLATRRPSCAESRLRQTDGRLVHGDAPLAPRRHERPQPRGVPPAGRDLSRHRRAGRLAHARPHRSARASRPRPSATSCRISSTSACSTVAARLRRPHPDPARPAALRRRHPRGRRRLRRRARRDRALARRQRARHRRHPRPRRRHALRPHPRREPGAGAEDRGADPPHRVRRPRPRPGAGRARHRRRPGGEPALHPAGGPDALGDAGGGELPQRHPAGPHPRRDARRRRRRDRPAPRRARRSSRAPDRGRRRGSGPRTPRAAATG